MLAERRLRKPGKSVFVGVGPSDPSPSVSPWESAPPVRHLTREEFISEAVRILGPERARAALEARE